MKKRIISVVLAVLLIFAFGCTAQTNSRSSFESKTLVQGSSQSAEFQIIGQGNIVFKFEVTDNNNAVAVWEVHTDETTVGAALLSAGLIKGDPGEYGLYVTEVNGVSADYNTDKAYWAFYVDGQYAVSGVDSTNIEPGKTYALVYTKD